MSLPNNNNSSNNTHHPSQSKSSHRHDRRRRFFAQEPEPPVDSLTGAFQPSHAHGTTRTHNPATRRSSPPRNAPREPLAMRHSRSTTSHAGGRRANARVYPELLTQHSDAPPPRPRTLERTMTEMEEEVKKKMERTHYIPPTLTLPDTPVSGCQSSCGECEHCIQSNEWDTQYTKEVNELAYLSNRHKCHKGCITKSHPTCKSRFPREVFAQTTVDPESGALNLKKGEAWINYYTPTLTYLLRCNSDVTSLLSGTAIKSVIAYITDYITYTKYILTMA